MRDAQTEMTDAKKRPFRIVRASLVAMPLAILLGAVLSPDPLVQMLAMVLTFLVVLPIAYRIVTDRGVKTRELALFFVLVLVFVFTGLWTLPQLIGDPSFWLGRLLVLVAGIVAAALTVWFVNGRAD